MPRLDPPKKHFDVHDKQDVEASMRAWTRSMKKSTKKVGYWKKRAASARAMVRLRKRQLKKLRGLSMGEKIIRQALKHVGEVEQPAGSNRGRNITRWQERFGLKGGGYAWCGAFAGSMVEFAGADLTNRVVYVPYIEEDARAGRNGFDRWIPVSKASHAPIGSMVVFNFDGGGPDHVGLLKEKVKSGTAATVEGNTSFDSHGSQSNGGCVAEKDRSLSLVEGFAVPKGL